MGLCQIDKYALTSEANEKLRTIPSENLDMIYMRLNFLFVFV
jgi:hypothetical protein